MPHALLARQLKRLGVEAHGYPSSTDTFQQLLERVSRTYTEADQDRYRLERSLSIASDEMQELYEALKLSSETRLSAERNKLQAIIRSLGAGLFLLDRDLRVTSANPEGERMLGSPELELVGRSLLELLFRPDVDQVPLDLEFLRVLATSGRSHADDDARLLCADGHLLPISYVLTPLLENADLIGVVVVFLDITERKQVEAALRTAYDELERRVEQRTAALAEANAGLQHMILERERAQVVLRQSEARFRSLVLNGSDVIAIIDSAGILSYASPSSMRVLGYSPEKCLHRCVFDVIHPEDLSQSIETLCQAGAESTLQAPHELRIQHANGSWCYVEVSATNLLDDPSVKGIVLNLHDITQRKRLEDQLVRQAFYDALTGLPNRVLVRDRLNHAIKRFQRSPFRLAVAYIDLDNFKTINDSLGHGVGDQLLQAVARRLVEGVRSSDTVARLGGDEFLVLLEDIGTDAEMNRVIERLNERLQAPLQLDRHELIVTASIGIALCCPDSTSDLLVRNADLAMYAAKAKGRSRYEIFHPQMNERARDRLELETDLRRAIRDDELRVVYQPVVVLPTGRMQGVEALVRWEHPRRGMIGPGEFIPLAEQTGLIIPLGLWVLNQSCRQAKAWQELCPDRPLQVSVNLSARQFSQAGLAESVASILHATQLDPALLKLEITESAAMEDGESAIAVMNELCQLGVQLAIDDFGTGYSSFSYLKRFPVNTLKIDRSFVDKLDQASEDRIIARAIIALAHALGLEVTGEGIETLEQRQILLEMGCELGQGYYFSRPTTPAAISAMLIEMDDVVAPPIRQSA